MSLICGVSANSSGKDLEITEIIGRRDSVWSLEGASSKISRYKNTVLLSDEIAALAEDGRYICIADGYVCNANDFRDNLKQAGIASDNPTVADVLLSCYLADDHDVFTKIRGAFVFAILDQREDLIILGRDMFGNKVIFYSDTPKGFLFSSSLTSLAYSAWPDKTIAEDGLIQYFSSGYICAPHTIYNGISQLETGHIVTFSRNSRKIIKNESFYSIEPISWQYHDLKNMSDVQVVDKFEELLISSMQCRQEKPGEAAVYLSGGRDTSMLTALLGKQIGAKVTAFTMGMKKGSPNDETHYARAVAKHLGVNDHKSYHLTADQFYDTIEQLPDLYGQPFADISAIPTNVIARLAAKDVDSIFCGDGPDFMFGNFDFKVLHYYYRFTKQCMRPGFAKLADVIIKNFFSEWVSPNLSVPQLLNQPEFFWIFQKKFQAGALNDILGISVDPYRFPSHRFIENRKDIPPRERLLLAEHMFYGIDNVFYKATLVHNAQGLRLHRPMYDDALFEFLRFLPTRYKFRNGRGRFLQNKLLERYLPNDLIYRPKRGFIVDFMEFGEARLRHLTDKYLTKERLSRTGFINADVAVQCVNEYFAGNHNRGPQMWVLLNFELWRERFSV